MRKIAIIQTSGVSGCYECDYGNSQMLISSITNWEEVDEQTYQTLLQASYNQGYYVLEQPTDVQGFIKKTISEYLAKIEADRKALEARKAAEEKKKLDRKLKRQAKDEASEKELLQSLLDKYGNPK